MGTSFLAGWKGETGMNLNTPYNLPFRVLYQQAGASGERDLTLRILLADKASADAADTIDSTILPFMLMGTSGAFAGESIEPWKSSVKEWTGPLIKDRELEWSLKSVNFNPQAWVMLAQMLLADHKKHPIESIEIIDPTSTEKMIEVSTGNQGFNPYPKSWTGISFEVKMDEEIYENFTVCVTFTRVLSKKERSNIDKELFAWAPGLILGAYGVAPIPPEKCTGFPDEDIVFIDNELEWAISDFRAHTGAIEGLVNVFASISEKIAPVQSFRVE